MYSIVTIKDTVRVAPHLFSKSLEDSVLESLKQYEGKLDKDLGVIIAVFEPREIGDGKIIPGDGATYHDAIFEALAFKPELHEVIRGKVNEITEFGAFVKLGPIDGLVHVSQVTDDFVSYNEKTGTLNGKETKRVLKKEDSVLARVIAISMKNTVTDSKINLTMRQPGLGKEDWAKEKEAKKIKK